MTRDDIIRMALEAGLAWPSSLAFDSDEYSDIWQTYTNVGREEIERFAALVAAEEREACTALLLEIKRKCQDADRLWQVEEFVDEAIRARGNDHD
jgi:hypothetical protein